MAQKESAGLLLFRRRPTQDVAVLEVLLGHPGGPYWVGKDDGAWTMPKGGIHAGENPLDTAIREFTEETGFAPSAPYIPLGDITQRGGKLVHAWAFEGDCDPAKLVSILAPVEWPPRSGRWIEVPEIDRIAFFAIAEAKRKINVAQIELLDRLVQVI